MNFDFSAFQQQLMMNPYHPLNFFICFVAGIVAAASPCVYPMLPITISAIAGGSLKKRERLVKASFYVLGMALVYSLIAVLVGFTGKALGIWTQNSFFYLLVGNIFLFLGLIMLGAIKNPFHAVQFSSLEKKFPQNKNMKAFLIGASSSFIAAPCTTPILSGILSFVLVTGSPITGFFLTFVFALGMGLPLFILGLTTHFLPKSGPWMIYVEKLAAVVIILMAEYFIFQSGVLA